MDILATAPFGVQDCDADALALANTAVGRRYGGDADPDGEGDGFLDAVVVGNGAEFQEGYGDVVVEGFAVADVDPVVT